MSKRIQVFQLSVAAPLYEFINYEVLAGLGVDAAEFWSGFSELVSEFSGRNRDLLMVREQMQRQIDEWHDAHSDSTFAEYKAFLHGIGYLVAEGSDFSVTPTKVDPEIANIAGPQLVVPIMNARFALNAVNARWGSLYDALYGNDVISESNGAGKGGSYNPVRGQKVIEYGRDFLDASVPLVSGSHHQAVDYKVTKQSLVITLKDGTATSLKNPEQFTGFQIVDESLVCILLKNNGLHIEIQLDSNHVIGREDAAGVKDIVLESALTTIMDCEDSVAAVDAEDKVLAYKNWLGLIVGDLEETIHRGDKSFVRRMAEDRRYVGVDGDSITLKGRSVMFVRNVGHLMTNPAILLPDGSEIYEGIMDAVITSLIGLYDLKRDSGPANSSTGSIYIVKPKMHGPDEVSFTNDLFDAVERLLGLSENAIKMGIMDEERRTSVNLKECIRAAQSRVVFINTGFLDRTGDEIHTSMCAGPFALKADLKKMPWISAYEDQNVDIGLLCGFRGKAQIGKGMWAIPDNMSEMMDAKVAHPKAGASCAWVPSPTAATLHAMHYHQIDVASMQTQLQSRIRAEVDDILTIPLLGGVELTDSQIQHELDNNAQGLLGYVVRWVEQGVGCSKVPDINNIGLMEDRATLRISSQHIANWLYHGICSPEQVMATLQRMALVVDKQNELDPNYVAMGPEFDQSMAFTAACELVFKGHEQPSGYTEPLLHEYRLKVKEATHS